MSKVIRRTLAGVGTVALLAVSVQLLGSTSASAHDDHVSGVSACQSNGTYTVTWTVSNDWNQGIDTVTVNGYTPSGAGLSPTTLSLNPVNTAGSSGTMTETGIPGNATTASLDVKGHWDYDGFTQPSRTGSVSLPGTCQQSQQPTAPSWANGACVNGKVNQPTITIPADEGITYTDNGTTRAPGTYQAGAGQHVVKATSSTVSLSGTTKWVFTLTEASNNCGPRTATPVMPSVTAINCVNHQPTHPNLVLPTSTGISYVPQVKAPYHAGQHVVVVAVAQHGYTFTKVPSGWQRDSSKRASTTVVMPKQRDCGSSITPAQPTVTQTYCPAGQTHPVAPTLTLPDNTAEISYRVVNISTGANFAPHATTTSYHPGQTVKVIATAKKGYYLAAIPSGWKQVSDNKATQTITFTTGPNICTVPATVTKPGFTARHCTGGTVQGGTYTIPSTTGVIYVVNGKQTPAGTYPAPPNSTVTVVATPKSHYKLVGQTTWKQSFGETPQCSVPSHTTPPHAIQAQHTTRTPTPQPLASTGVPTMTLVGAGLMLLLVGGLLTVVATHRREGDGPSGS